MDAAKVKSDLPDYPLVSLVTPSFNQGRFIRATIESILSQDYPNIEYIIMDGASADETGAIAAEYASRLHFVSKPDRGQSHAINEGFHLAHGNVLGWLNSDDVLLPGAVTAAVRALTANPDAGMVYGDGYLIDAAGNVTGRFPHTREPNLWRLVHLSDYILQQATFMRRDVLADIGYVDESLHYGMDWDLFIRIGLKYRLAYLPECLGCIREYPETKSSSGGAGRIRELHAMLRKHTGLRLPPGSIVYGLDTYAGLACEAIRRRTPGVARPVGNFLEQAVRFAAGRVVSHTIEHSQGLYDDGWAGKTLLYMLPAGCKSVQVEGSVPDCLREQVLLVECSGRPLGRFNLPAGPFRIAIEIPTGLATQPIVLRVVARHCFIPSQIPFRGDRRRLAFQLGSVSGAPSLPA